MEWHVFKIENIFHFLSLSSLIRDIQESLLAECLQDRRTNTKKNSERPEVNPVLRTGPWRYLGLQKVFTKSNISVMSKFSKGNSSF